VLAVEILLHRAANQRSARSAANQHDFLDILGHQLRVGEGFLHRTHGAVYNRSDQSIKGAARKLAFIHFAIRKRESQRGRRNDREFVLKNDQFLAEFLGKLTVRGKIKLILQQDLLVDERLQQIVDIVATQVSVAVGGKYLIDVTVCRGD
jgi:NAD-specific glutamate dehydrogenase